MHKHINEQINIVEAGTLKVHLQDQTYIIKPGQIIIFPPNVPHEFVAVTDTIFYDIQTPARLDFLEPDFIKKLAKKIEEKPVKTTK